MKWLIIGLFIIIAGMIALNFHLYQKISKPYEEAEYWKKEAFKPDTVKSNNTYRETLRIINKYPDSVPPQQVIVYANENNEAQLKFQEKVLLVLDSLKQTRTQISHEFITNFPTNPKLLQGGFSKDSVNLVLLGIDGITRKEKYPVNFEKYLYSYDQFGMRAMERPTSLLPNTRTQKQKSVLGYEGTYLFYKHDFLQAEHQLEISGDFRIWKLKIGPWGQAPISSISNLKKIQGGVKAGWELF